MSHRGSILALPSGIHAWEARTPAEITAATLRPLLAEAARIELLLVGTGAELVPLDESVRRRLGEAGLRADAMPTHAAASTYNVLLAEDRRVAAALLAVD
ncbi:MAG: Mth938-like domain-containing protein [Methylobacteriaceae bacterium]|nr:Mth938-like domain-containing protein [Methylobacteriaceae bacterium]